MEYVFARICPQYICTTEKNDGLVIYFCSEKKENLWMSSHSLFLEAQITLTFTLSAVTVAKYISRKPNRTCSEENEEFSQ